MPTALDNGIRSPRKLLAAAGQRFPEEAAALESRYGFTLAQEGGEDDYGEAR